MFVIVFEMVVVIVGGSDGHDSKGNDCSRGASDIRGRGEFGDDGDAVSVRLMSH